MLLKGSCHCQSVKFQVESKHPYPFNFCYCSICRKTAGGGGYVINLSADAESLAVEGKEYIGIYNAKTDSGFSTMERNFCRNCASALWVYDPKWPELLHPFASAIDTRLPVPPERTHLMLSSKKSWVEADVKANDKCFSEYPEESIAQWHERLNLVK